MIKFEGTLEELMQLVKALTPPPFVVARISPYGGDQILHLMRGLKTGDRITAIKAVRDLTGLELKESKDLVEAV